MGRRRAPGRAQGLTAPRDYRECARMMRALLLASTIALAACESEQPTNFIGAAPVSHDGVWTGTARRSSGNQRECPDQAPFVVTIEGTAVRGEVRDRRNQEATVSRFECLVDPDGRIATRAWYDGTRNDLSLDYNGTRFVGMITNSNSCTFNLRLSRA